MIESTKYPYPFSNEVLENRDIASARKQSRELQRWVFAPKVETIVNDKNSIRSNLGKQIRIILEPDTLTFVDNGMGVIKFSLRYNNEGFLLAHGGLYNPKKGKETLITLVDILQFISKNLKKNIIYTTSRVNKTTQLENLLIESGFTKVGDEYQINIQPTGISLNEYPEVLEEITKLDNFT